MRTFFRSMLEKGKQEWEEIDVKDVKRGDKLKVITNIEEENRVEIIYFEALSGYNKEKGEVKKLKPLISKPIIGKIHPQ